MKLIRVKRKDLGEQVVKNIPNKRDGNIVEKDKDKDGCIYQVYQNSAGNFWYEFSIPKSFEPYKYMRKFERTGEYQKSPKYYKNKEKAILEASLILNSWKREIRERSEFFRKNYPEYQNQ